VRQSVMPHRCAFAQTALAATLVAACASAAAAGSVNGVSMLRIAGGPNGEIVQNENTTLHTMSWNIADGDAQSYSTFNDRNTSLAFCSAGNASGVPWDVSSKLYGGDVVVFKVAGATTTQITTINITVKALGSGTSTTSAALDYCIGNTAAGACASALDPVVAEQMKLPAPTRVKVAGGGHADSSVQSIFDYQHTVALKIRGAKAVVPLWYSLQSACKRNAKSIVASASSQLASMEVALPAGVTCTSRSGKAFDGKCLAAAAGQ
jgi:hypothetical protein